jgi:hypothetical protein
LHDLHHEPETSHELPEALGPQEHVEQRSWSVLVHLHRAVAEFAHAQLERTLRTPKLRGLPIQTRLDAAEDG